MRTSCVLFIRSPLHSQLRNSPLFESISGARKSLSTALRLGTAAARLFERFGGALEISISLNDRSDARADTATDLRPGQLLLIAKTDHLLAIEHSSGPAHVLACRSGSGLAGLDRLRLFAVLHFGVPGLDGPQ